MSKPLRSMSMAEVCAAAEQQRKDFWARTVWKLDTRTLVLRHGNYEVDLETCRTSAEVLDWLAQLRGKLWCSEQDFVDLFDALNYLIRFQQRMCSNGNETMRGRNWAKGGNFEI